MNSVKRNKVLYWLFTVLVLLPQAGSAIPELLGSAPAAVTQSLQLLGYPLYLLQILAVAKILGAIAILVNRPKTLKEWAYAGYSFEFLGATASHLLAGDYSHAPLPFVFFFLLMGSYIFWNKTEKTA